MPFIKADNFSLVHSLFSGQCFGWQRIGVWYYGEIAGRPVKVSQVRSKLYFDGVEEREVRKYFALNENIEKIYSGIATDPVIENAVEEFRGLRILKQDPWVCSVSFLCSISCNIPGIELQLRKLKHRYGTAVEFDGHRMHLFPRPVDIGNASLKELRKCSLGFRDRYVKSLGERMGGFEIEELRDKEYAEAKDSLMESFGIGPKVADCICLFSLDKTEAFPIDVWIQRAMVGYYGKEIRRMIPKTRFSYKDVQKFAWERWGKDAGYAQQFLYVYSKKDLKQKGRNEH